MRINRQDADIVTCTHCGFEIDLLDLVTVSEAKADNESTFEINQPVEVESLGIGDSLGRFTLVGKLGQGGFGSVFEAYDANLDRNVAIKIPKSESVSETQARLFLREARLAAQLQSPNIVSVFEVGRDFDREIFFIVSELIRGDTLRTWARKQERTEKETATIMETICRAVHRAHLAGIIHRDLKPGNVLVDAEDQPHITDFGLAKRLGGQEFTVAREGALLGTLIYMSPEQADGGSNRADARTDVYALGVLLYVLLSGKKPFSTTSNSILHDIISGKAIPLRKFKAKVSPDLELICNKAMEKEPDLRYQTADQLANDLQRFLEGRPLASNRGNILRVGAYALRRNWLVTSVMLMLVTLGVIWNIFNDRPASAELDQPKEPTIYRVGLDVPRNAQAVQVRRVQYEKFGGLSPPFKANVSLSGNGLRVYDLVSGLYLVDFKIDGRPFEFYRYVFADEGRSVVIKGFLRDFTRDKASDSYVLNPLKVYSPSLNANGTYQLGLETMVFIEGGSLMSFSTQPRINDQGRTEKRFPRKPVEIEPFLISETEVLATDFFTVMGRYPTGMRVANLAPGTVAYGVTWDEAVEYCERVGGRLPKFDEYVFVATNRGTTEFPWGDVPQKGPWVLGPAGGDPSDQVLGVKGLFSNYGEWLWDINLGGPSSLLMQDQAAGSLKWHDERLVAGLPFGAASNIDSEVERLDAGPQADSPRTFSYLFGDIPNRRMGFRVVYPMPTTKKK